MTREKALLRLAILPQNVRDELSGFYQMLANVDGTLHPEEQFLLGDFESAQADSTEAVAALAALALRSRRAEAPEMLMRIRNGQEKHFKSKGTYVTATLYPPLSSGKIRLWETVESGRFQELDFKAPTEVRGSYWIEEKDNLIKHLASSTRTVMGSTPLMSPRQHHPQKQPHLRRFTDDLHVLYRSLRQ